MAQLEPTHGSAYVNGVDLHYVRAGEGPPLLLLHGWPQTWYEWRDVLGPLAKQYTVIAPDLRGMGDSGKPREGYDKRTVADDTRELVHELGFEEVAVVGHDWGMPTAYAYAARYREEVQALAVMEAMLPGVREDDKLGMLWHVRFHQVRDLPERLVSGNEETYLKWFYREGAYDPSAIDREALAEYVRSYSAPGGLRGGFEYYRAYEEDAEHNKEHTQQDLEMPVLALGGEASFGSMPVQDMEAVATDVDGEVVERAGHWIPEERPDYLVERLRGFLEDAGYAP
jgi:pimeloyl-ACP methyl ester carboxylesterase